LKNKPTNQIWRTWIRCYWRSSDVWSWVCVRLEST